MKGKGVHLQLDGNWADWKVDEAWKERTQMTVGAQADGCRVLVRPLADPAVVRSHAMSAGTVEARGALLGETSKAALGRAESTGRHSAVPLQQLAV